MSMRLRRLPASALVVALIAAAVSVLPLAAPAARAAGSPDIALTRDVASQTLYGDAVAVTLTAHNPSTTDDGFNLTFTDTLPAGAVFASGSPAPDQQLVQTDGSTILVWSNVSDLQAGTTSSVSYTFTYPQTAAYALGSTPGGTAGAYVNSDERTLPQVSPTGVVTGSTGSDTASSTTTLVPFQLKKELVNFPENEILRGVHDHKAVYRLTVTNNAKLASTAFSIDDYLPADLEFLGCTDADASAPGTEYPGSGRIDGHGFPTLADCQPAGSTLTSSTVTVDPDGAATTLSSGVYTKATWTDLPGLAAGGSLVIEYAAAVPLRQNAQANGDATANLDNNTGALTSDEEPIVNYAAATGTTSGNSYTVGAYEHATAEDVAIQKSVDHGTISHGDTSTWTLNVESSEYTTSTGTIVVTDTIPDGLDYAATTSGQPLSSGPTANADGTQTVAWTLPAFTAKNGTAQIVYTTTTRATYRATGKPVAANDSWTNTVHLTTDATDIAAPSGATATAPVIDDSQAGQEAQPITLDKEVAEPTGSVAADCSTSSLTWEDDATGPTHGFYRPGDTVCWRLTVNFPGQLDTVGTRIRDVLPPGFNYVEAHATAANNVSAVRDTGVNPLRWTVDDATSGTTFQWIVTSTWSDPTASAPGAVQGNLMKLRYNNTAGGVFQLRDLANVQLAKPVLAIAKSVTPTTSSAGGAVAYTITVSNTGNADAVDATVTDTLPGGWSCADVTSTGTCASGVITWTGLAIPAGGSTPLHLTGTVPADAGAGDAYTNTAAVTHFANPTNTGGTFAYTSTEKATATVNVPGVTLAKSASPTNVRLGDTVTYTLTGSIPAHTTLYDSPRITDTMPAGVTVTGVTSTVGGVAGPTPTFTAGSISAPISATSTFANTTGAAIPVVVTVTATLPASSGRNAGDSLGNTAHVVWSGSTGAGSTPQDTPSNTTAQTVVEPALSIAKQDDAGSKAVPGATVTFTLTARNTGTSDSNETTVTDVVPAQTTPLKAGGAPVTTTGDTVDSTGATGVWDQTNRTITFAVGTLSAGGTTTITYRTKVDDPLVSDGKIINTATVTGTSMPGTVTGERTYTPAPATDTLTNPVIALTKTASPSSATIGQRVSYTIVATVPASTQAFDATLVDALPAHVSWESLTSTACSDGTATPCSIAPVVIGTPSSSDTTVGFFLGDIASGAAQRTVTIVYTGIVRANAIRGEAMKNTATLRFDTSDKVTGTPSAIPGSFDTTGAKASATVTEVEPLLGLQKTVAGGITGAGTSASPMRATPGTALAYTVTATNSGTSTAYATTVKDLLPALASCATVTAISDGGVCDAPSRTITWSLAALPSTAGGNSKAFTYTVTVPAGLTSSSENAAGPELVNVADAPSYAGLDVTDPANTGLTPKTYTEDPKAEADVELDLASLGGTIWQEWAKTGNAVGTLDADDPRLSGVPVTVTFLGADGILGNADDEVHHVTTGSDGTYLVSNLPAGAYDVTVDASTLVARGLAPAFDADGIASPNLWTGTRTLGEAEDLRGIDFSYQGTGSIGDTVWFDRDRDGTQNGPEPGLSGFTVTLTDTASGLTATTTTDASGKYLFPTLPAGSYTVAVTTPSGSDFGLVSEPAGAANGTSSVTLAAGANDLAQDFGYAGSGSIGDLVWLDRDKDGVQDADEPGLVGVTVTITWGGQDGGLGTTTDNATFTTTTGADGKYELGGLPAGAYRVAVTGGLPSGAVATYDQDGKATAGTTDTTLSAGQARSDIDFGYDAATHIGDFVWWDANGDGVQDPGEPGLPGVPVTVVYAGQDGRLSTTADNITYHVTTDANGKYDVSQISEGTYSVTVTPPTGFTPTGDANSPVGSGDNTSVKTIGSGGDDTQDFGYTAARSLGDTLWLDLDGDGAQQAGEPGLPNVTVSLTTKVNGTDVTRSTTTDAAGHYSFGGLPSGDYTVKVDSTKLPGGLASTTDTADATPNGTSTVTIAATDRTDVDFGYRGTGALGDVVWLDEDGDGVHDAGEPGIPGATVTVVWAGPDGDLLNTADNVTYARTTDSHGAWSVDHLPAGSYTVTVTGILTGLVNSGDPDHNGDGTTTLTLAAGAAATADFGYRGAASVGDLVWIDVDGDGVRGPFEPGVGGLPVTVRMAGVDLQLGTADDIVATATTDADGKYLVTGMPGGDVRVSYDRGDLPAGQKPSSDLDDDVADGDAASTEFTLGVADDKRDVDFVVIGTSSLSGVVFDDANADGVQNPGERGVGGVAVVVVWHSPTGPIPMQVTSAADGSWSLPHVPAGSYTVTEDPTTFPAGFHPSTVTERSVTVPAGGTTRVVFGISTALLAATGMTIAPWWPGAAVLLLLGIAAVLWSVRRRRMGTGPVRA